MDRVNDHLTWDLTPAADVKVAGGQSSVSLYNPSDPRRFGMLLDQNFNFVDPFLFSNWMIGCFLTVTVQNEYSCQDAALNMYMPESFSIGAQIFHTLFLDSTGSPTDQVTDDMVPTVCGTLEPPTPADCGQ